MYRDSDDESLSGDDADDKSTPRRTKSRGSGKRGRPKKARIGGRSQSPMTRKSSSTTSATTTGIAAKRDAKTGAAKGATVSKENDRGPDRSSLRPVIVVDYDLTLVDRASRPFPKSKEFLETLRKYHEGLNTTVLYSHGTKDYVHRSLTRNYPRWAEYFDVILSDGSARSNKPVTYVREKIKAIKPVEYLIGPYVILDDTKTNLDDDQYDIVIDVTRMTEYDRDGRAVSVDFEECLRLINEGVKTFASMRRKQK